MFYGVFAKSVKVNLGYPAPSWFKTSLYENVLGNYNIFTQPGLLQKLTGKHLVLVKKLLGKRFAGDSRGQVIDN